MSEIKQINSIEASKKLSEDPDNVFLDVRTEQEFAAGHPDGALNVPVVFLAGGGPTPNPDFLRVVEKLVPKERPVLCSCQSGGRSLRASKILADAGYTDVSNVQGGFGGARDATGKTVVKGWRDSGLPVSTDVSEAVSYAGLKRKAGV